MGADESKPNVEGGKRPTATSLEKVRKQKVLESVPGKIYDSKSKGNEPTTIRKASKQAALEDTTPLYKPNLPKPKQQIDLPIKELKETFNVPKVGPTLITLSPPKRERKSIVLSSSLRKGIQVSDRKLEEDKARKVAEAKAKKIAVEKAKKIAEEKAKKVAEEKEKTVGDSAHEKPILKTPDGGGKPVRKDKVRDFTRRGVQGYTGTNRADDKDPYSYIDEKWDEALKVQSTTTLASKVIKKIRAKVHEGGDLHFLHEFKIPDQRQLLTVALVSDTHRCDFGGNLRQYYSPVLKNYVPFNMLERYRGAHPTSPCLSAVDVSSLGNKEKFVEREKQKRRAARDKQLNALHEAAIDETHFDYLKQLSDNQPVSLPLTMVHDIATELLPIINRMQAFYNKKLGPNHECTEQATQSFIKMLNRTMMYNSM